MYEVFEMSWYILGSDVMGIWVKLIEINMDSLTGVFEVDLTDFYVIGLWCLWLVWVNKSHFLMCEVFEMSWYILDSDLIGIWIESQLKLIWTTWCTLYVIIGTLMTILGWYSPKKA